MVPELSLNTRVGQVAWWKTLDGRRHKGVLKEWDSGTAIMVLDDGREVAVRCV